MAVRSIDRPRTGSRRPEDFNTPIKDRGDIVQLEEEYETAKEIPCAIVGCGQPHKKGRYALLFDGNVSRVGHVCGKRLLGDETYTQMHREFEQRRQRELRRRFISADTFDPEGALAALQSWNERIRTMRELRSELADVDNQMFNDICYATMRQDGKFEILNPATNKYEPVRLRGTHFLLTGWHDGFLEARQALLRVARMYKKQDPSDDELAKIVHDAGEASSGFRSAKEVIDSFNVFLFEANP